MKTTLANLLLIVFLILGCNPQPNRTDKPKPELASPPVVLSECDPKSGQWEVPNGSAFSLLSSDVVTWEIYRQLYSVPEKEISKISIEYDYLGWEFINRCYEINLSGDGYETRGGVPVDKDKVREFADSLGNLRLSGGTKGCINHTDDYPNFRVEVEYNNGRKAILYSWSNCTNDRTPWNVVYDGKLYFQSTGEIPKALNNLLASFDDTIGEWWSPEWVATTFSGGGSRFSLVSNYHPPEIERLTFSEERVFMDAVIDSGALDSYLSKFKLVGMELACPMSTNCAEVIGKARLKSENGLFNLVDIRVSSNGKITLEEDAQPTQLVDADIKLAAHPIIQLANSAKSDLKIEVKCNVEKECKKQEWCSALFSQSGTSPTMEELVCEVNFWMEYPQQFIYFPRIDQFWVKKLIVDLDETVAENKNDQSFPKWKPRIEPLISLFDIKGETFLQDHGNGIYVMNDEEQCNRISLDYEDSAWKSGEVGEFSNRLQDYYGYQSRYSGLSIYGYCVFIDTKGNFIVYKRKLSLKGDGIFSD